MTSSAGSLCVSWLVVEQRMVQMFMIKSNGLWYLYFNKI